MPRKRSNESRIDWPTGFYARLRGGSPYYFWRSPKTKKEYGLGRDLESSKAQAAESLEAENSLYRSDTGKISRRLIDLGHEGIVERSVPVEIAWCGVYFLIKDHLVVYVGKSTNIGARLREHKRDRLKDFDRFAHIQCEQHELDFLESLYIKKLKPRYNVAMNNSFRPNS